MASNYKKQNLAFGLWPSPISVVNISQRLGLQDVQWNSDGQTLIWLESRSGVNTLYAKTGSNARQALTEEHNVRGTVGYGGGDFWIDQGRIVFAERNGRLYQRILGYARPKPVTPPFGHCAAPVLSPDDRWIVYVHSDDKTDVVAVVDVDGQHWPQQLATGADFYMQPAWHPDGSQLAWIEWDHPNMPWDGTRLILASIEGSPPQILEKRQISGGKDIPVSQPLFSPDGRWLSYLVCNSEWESLVLLNLITGEERTLVEGDGFTLSMPAWVQGIHNYGWNTNSQSLIYSRFTAGVASLWSVEIENGSSHQIDTGAYTSIQQVSVSPTSNEVAFIASGPSIPEQIIRWDGNQLHVIARSEPENISPDYLPVPEHVTWPGPDGMLVHGLFYPPQNPDYTCNGLPPAIIHIHGGPTSSATVRYNAEAAYFTSRGYAYLELNYRGSTGFGRSYQEALLLRWGLVDVEDTVGAAEMLENQKLADGNRLVVSGGSAGGYTVLNSLIHYPGRFKAGICRFGVSNLFTLAMDTHKFEERYNDSLVGILPDHANQYHAFSPIFHVDKIQDPLAIFQGSEDKVVPPDQSEAIVSALSSRGIPHVYRLYEGEGHGFRKSENIADYIQQTERFLQQYVLFAP
jgi:dipeptidyl aminopeptidase/acylaminoacyl peptidase